MSFGVSSRSSTVRALVALGAAVMFLAAMTATTAAWPTDPDGGSDKPPPKPGQGHGHGYGWYRHMHHAPGGHDPAGSGSSTSTGSPNAGPTDRASLVNDPGADTNAHDTQSETTVMPAGPNVVVAYNDSGSYALSPLHFDGWATTPAGSSSFADHGALPNDPTGEGDGGDPFLARDAVTGRVYLTTLGGNTFEHLQVFASDDNGLTFGPPVNSTPGWAGTYAFQDKPSMSVDNAAGNGQGNVYVAWTSYPDTGDETVRLSRSTDHGSTWGPNQGTVIATAAEGAFVVTAPNHAVLVFYWDHSGSTKVIRVRTSTDGGITFGPAGLVATTSGPPSLTGFRTNPFPSVAVNPVTGAFYVVFNSTNGSDRSDVFITSSTNGGATWSPKSRLSDSGARDQYSPAVAVSADGTRLFASFYDRRNDPINALIQRYGAVATIDPAGQLAFRPNFAMSPAFPVARSQDGVVADDYMGDYDTVAADGGSFFSAWGDNRDGDNAHAVQPDVRFLQLPINLTEATSDLTVAAVTDPGPRAIGQTTTIDLTVTNHGPDDASLANTMTTVPAGLRVDGVRSSQGDCTSFATVTCALGQLANGATATVHIDATITAAGTLAATSTVASAGSDPNPLDNTASVSVASVGPTTHQLYSTGDLALAIPDVKTIDQIIHVPDAGTVSSLAVNVRLNHTYDSDLHLFLTAPDGTAVQLATSDGGSGDNYGSGAANCSGTPATFVDTATGSVLNGSAPFAGRYRPELPLSALAGKGQAGDWHLRITDGEAQDSGTLYCASLDITRSPAPVDTFSVSDARVVEGGPDSSGTAGFTVSRTGDSSGPATVSVATAGATATSGVDFQPLPATRLSFGPGETAKSVSVSAIGDAVPEPEEIFSVALSSASGATIADATGIGTIVDDDPGDPATLSIADTSVLESNTGVSPMTFTVTRNGDLSEPVSVKWATTTGSATAGVDFQPVPSTALAFAAGESVKTVTVGVLADTVAEHNETVVVSLSSAVHAVITDASATGTIVDDDGTSVVAAPSTFVAVSDARVTEGGADTTAPLTFVVTRTGDTSRSTTVTYSTAAGTATGGVDFQPLAATKLVFAPGETSKTVSVSVIGDARPEPDETVSLRLASPIGGVITDASGAATIVDDDAGQPATVSVADASVIEGTGGTTGLAFNVVRSGDTSEPVSVLWSTAAGTASSGVDFQPVASTALTFAAGETVKTVVVSVVGDAAPEGNETVFVRLASANQTVISDSSATGTIVDDD